MTLIDKDSLLEKLSTFHPDYTFNITAFRNFVKAQPEVKKKGKWIESETDGFVCSECRNGYKNQPTLMGKPMFEYCPVCGAKMEK